MLKTFFFCIVYFIIYFIINKMYGSYTDNNGLTNYLNDSATEYDRNLNNCAGKYILSKLLW